MRIVITGAAGLIGWHAWAHLHAANCAAKFADRALPYDIVALNHAEFEDPRTLEAAVTDADAVLHFAGVNRGLDQLIEVENPAIAHRLVAACKSAGAAPHIVYANSIQMTSDTPYGRSKRIAGEILGEESQCFTNFILPHIFGEGARPYYNNVTATLIDQILKGETPTINPDGNVKLLHAGAAAQMAIDAATAPTPGDLIPEAFSISVPELSSKLNGFHTNYSGNVYPNLSDPFDLQLFNSYRCASYPRGWPRPLKLNTDARGTLFEAVKGGGGGQTFLSVTKPRITRGDHFHLAKVERFLVLEGEAIIRIRKIGSDVVWEYQVSGDAPASVDMPTLHTHSIENIGEGPLLTLFWSHDQFNPQSPDTFADRVLK